MNRQLKPEVEFAGRRVGPGHPVLVVAEMSANHRQSLSVARELVHAAREVGADAVKVQTYTPDTLTIASNRPEFVHGGDSLWAGESLYELYRRAYLPWEWHGELKELAERLGLLFFSTAYDPTAVRFLAELGVPAIKIASFELVDTPLLELAAAVGRPLVVSTGMATLEEIEAAVSAVERAGGRELILLQCTSGYPARPEEMNLRAIPDLASRFGCPVGLSDHTQGVEVPAAAVALGACVLEKHLTLERGRGVDGGFSLDPEGFRATVAAVRRVEAALGEARYGPEKGELQSLQFRRSLWVVRPVQAGDAVSPDNVRSIRPAGGMPPALWPHVAGRRFRRAIDGPAPLREEDLE